MLVRFHVTTESLLRLLQVTATLYRKAHRREDSTPNQIPSNIIANAVVDILTDGLRMKTRVLPVTLGSLAEVSQPFQTPVYPIETQLSHRPSFVLNISMRVPPTQLQVWQTTHFNSYKTTSGRICN
jgi:hypothetical protein